MQHLAISVAAFMVAIVLATREFLQCLLGFFYYLFTRPFRAGDWIEVNRVTTGEVYSIDWLKITLLEVASDSSEYTGKTAYIPNNWLVTKQLKNLNFMRRYATHTFTLTVQPEHQPVLCLTQIQKRLNHHCEPFHDVAQRYKERIERHMETEFLTVEPQVMVKTNHLGMIELHFSLFCPTEKASQLENIIAQEVLELLPSPNYPPPKRNYLRSQI